jgi:hypothetical protein
MNDIKEWDESRTILEQFHKSWQKFEHAVDEIIEEQRNIRLLEMMEKRWGFKRVDEG